MKWEKTMKSESTTREENLADLDKIIATLEDIEAAFDQIIANTEAAYEKKRQDVDTPQAA